MKSQIININNIATVKGGKRLPKGYELITTPTRHPYIRARDIGNGKIEAQEPVYITDSTFQKIRQYTVKNNDIVITIVGVNIGDVGIVTEKLDGANLTENAAKISTNINVCNPNFLLCQLATLRNKFKFQQIAVGAAQGKLGLFKIKDFKILLPPINSQKSIADIYFTYTNLININHRRIKLLEEAARLLFREWFVYFCFLGHEKVKVVDGVPEGWKKEHLSKLVSTQYGYTETASQEEIGPKFLRGKDINKTSYIDWSSVPYCSNKKLDFRKYSLSRGDILIIRMADPGKVGIVEVEIEAIFASYLVRLKVINKSISSYYLFYSLSNDKYQGFITGSSTGSTRKSASAKLLVDYYLLIPKKEIIDSFGEQVIPIRKKINILLQQNKKLAQARDLLLPRLMSGAIEVKNCEKE